MDKKTWDQLVKMNDAISNLELACKELGEGWEELNEKFKGLNSMVQKVMVEGMKGIGKG